MQGKLRCNLRVGRWCGDSLRVRFLVDGNFRSISERSGGDRFFVPQILLGNTEGFIGINEYWK